MPFCYAIKKYSLSVTLSKNGYTSITHYLSTTIYLFFFLCLYRVLLRPGCLRRHNSGSRGRGGEALAQPPPPAHVFSPTSNSSFLRFAWGKNLARHHKTLFDCLPYFLNYCLLVISTLLPVFDFFVQISILTLLRIFTLFFGFFSL